MNNQSAVDIEQFLEYLETSETADDALPEEIEAAEKAYQEYLEGRDPGKSLVELKAGVLILWERVAKKIMHFFCQKASRGKNDFSFRESGNTKNLFLPRFNINV